MKAVLRSLELRGSLLSVKHSLICAAVAISLFALLQLLQHREARDKGGLLHITLISTWAERVGLAQCDSAVLRSHVPSSGQVSLRTPQLRAALGARVGWAEVNNSWRDTEQGYHESSPLPEGRFHIPERAPSLGLLPCRRASWHLTLDCVFRKQNSSSSFLHFFGSSAVILPSMKGI